MSAVEHARDGLERLAFREFAAREVAPRAGAFDRLGELPLDMRGQLADAGYLGAVIPREYGGSGYDPPTFGALNEELGAACSSVRSLVTVQSMVASAIMRWGTTEQRERWLPALASGEATAAFALSEPDVGSDAAAVKTTARRRGAAFALNGRKKWTSFGEIADVILVLATLDGVAVAFLVEGDRPGLSRYAITGLLGLRASMLAELEFEGCLVPQENVLGAPGFGLMAVASTALDVGRYSVACGCIGMIRACLEAAVQHARSRRQFSAPLADHQLIKKMIAEMAVDLEAGALLCRRAGELRAGGDPAAIAATFTAKYFAATRAAAAAAAAVQIHGAAGCCDAKPVERHFRDAKIMEIIEGSNQIGEVIIADHVISGGRSAPVGAGVNL